MSPEDLLRHVLKFGEEQENEEATGIVFVSVAFEKAKELTSAAAASETKRTDDQRSGV